MTIDLSVRGLEPLNLEGLLERPKEELRKIFQEGGGPGGPPIDEIEEIIQRLKKRKQKGQTFEQATDVPRREWLLLSIYLEYHGKRDAKDWLPELDDRIAESILGNSGRDWSPLRRIQAALLFFDHFDQIPALSFLCDRLLEAYANPVPTTPKWHAQRQLIFAINGPEKLAHYAKDSSGWKILVQDFHLPETGRYVEKLRHIIFLKVLKKVPFGKLRPIFGEIEKHKNETVGSGMRLGAAALQIMIGRVMKEGNGQCQWPEEWSKWITRFCDSDPRHGRSTAKGTKWWGWATEDELRCAQKGMACLYLGFFIRFLWERLRGTEAESHFKLRKNFLLGLLEAGKIQDQRLVLNSSDFRKLDSRYRQDKGSVARLTGTTRETSIICLKCVDDIYIIEGTHNFGLRAFRKHFPIPDFWSLPEPSYPDKKLRVSPRDCPIFIRQTRSGSWIDKFFNELRVKFHVEWNDVVIKRN